MKEIIVKGIIIAVSIVVLIIAFLYNVYNDYKNVTHNVLKSITRNL